MKTITQSTILLFLSAVLLLPGGSLAARNRTRLTEFFDPLVLVSSLRPVLCYDTDRNGSGYVTEEILATEDRSTSRTEKYYAKSVCSAGPDKRFIFEMEYTIAPEYIHVDYTLTPEARPGRVTAWGLAFQPRGLKGVRYAGRLPFRVHPYKGSGRQAARRVLLDLWQGTMHIDGVRCLEVDPARPDEILLYGNEPGQSGKEKKSPSNYKGSITITLQ
ncbi:MAG: hypothetical protein IJU34_08080 [Bacteroidales bacterium]|nr:hypothetical protein [Bacteroidales bacterium]